MQNQSKIDAKKKSKKLWQTRSILEASRRCPEADKARMSPRRAEWVQGGGRISGPLIEVNRGNRGT